MIRNRCFPTLAATFLFSVAAWGQQTSGQGTPSAQLNAQNANNVCRVFFTTPKPGMVAQFEQARLKHMQFHKQQNDTWTWYTWQIATGESTGSYVTSSCGHAWKDFDEWDKKMGKADAADALAGMGPFEQSTSNSFFIYRADMSLGAANRPPTAMDAVTIYSLHPGAAPDFTVALTKIKAALEKQPNWPKTSGWLQLANGGDAPTYVLLNARQNWSEFAPLDKSVQEVITETNGKEDADAIYKTIRDSAVRVTTETAVYRPDLSYLPK